MTSLNLYLDSKERKGDGDDSLQRCERLAEGPRPEAEAKDKSYDNDEETDTLSSDIEGM